MILEIQKNIEINGNIFAYSKKEYEKNKNLYYGYMKKKAHEIMLFNKDNVHFLSFNAFGVLGGVSILENNKKMYSYYVAQEFDIPLRKTMDIVQEHLLPFFRKINQEARYFKIDFEEYKNYIKRFNFLNNDILELEKLFPQADFSDIKTTDN